MTLRRRLLGLVLILSDSLVRPERQELQKDPLYDVGNSEHTVESRLMRHRAAMNGFGGAPS